MVGEGGQAGDLGVAGAQRVGEFPRPPDAGEGETPPPGETVAIARPKRAAKYGLSGSGKSGGRAP